MPRGYAARRNEKKAATAAAFGRRPVRGRFLVPTHRVGMPTRRAAPIAPYAGRCLMLIRRSEVLTGFSRLPVKEGYLGICTAGAVLTAFLRSA